MSKEYDVRGSIIYGLHAGRTSKQISEFNNIPQRMVYNMKKVYDAENNVTPARKKHNKHKDCTNPEIVHRIQEIINEDPGKSMRYIAREMNMSDVTIRKIVANDIRYKSYALRRAQFMKQHTKERSFIKAKKLLTKLIIQKKGNL